ncbi:DUF6243 family protein [Streptomyces bikiniensis]|uniref:DUF6243 family protein n=1 Tax=Streptomyces bikiniensis TaxID=1896 RepID=UPI0004BF3904|nr:DUF6243 family protein [Streptomyces bikiniensis]
MAKSRNNLLGVGGQRKKLSRADQQATTRSRAADRRTAADQKQELLRKMRERAQEAASGTEGAGSADTTGTGRE